jgi:pilus assembly protein CpaE
MAPPGNQLSDVREPENAWVAGDDRAMLMAFVTDAASEATLRDGLADATPASFEVLRGGIRAAISTMQKIATPRSLVVDISGEQEPLSALHDLSQVVEPDVHVLVVGELTDLNFYRELTRGMGAVEYLPKPLTRDMVMRLFAPVIVGRPTAAPELSGGRVITVTGARGGVGATSIAVSLAWHFGVERSRHTVLLDPDLQTGTAALYLEAPTGPGLRAALEMPDRIDDLFLERASQLLKDRLHVLVGQEAAGDRPVYAADAAPRLLAALRRRYNLVVVDVPFQPVPLYRDLLDLASQRVIVFEPTLAGARDALRLRALHDGQNQSSPTVLVLNRAGMPGGLTQAQIEDALEGRVNITIPDLPKRLAVAANMGQPAIRQRSFFRLRVGDLARLVAFNRLLDSSASQEIGRRLVDKKRRWQFWKKT